MFNYYNITFNKGLSIIEALLVLCISLVLGIIVVPVLLLRLGIMQRDVQDLKSSVTSLEVSAQTTVAPSVNLPKRLVPILPSLNFDAGRAGDSAQSERNSKSPLSSPVPEEPSSKP